jgi:hypothetical protein
MLSWSRRSITTVIVPSSWCSIFTLPTVLEVFNSSKPFSFIFYLQLNLLTVLEKTQSPFYPSTFRQEAAISLQRDQTEAICSILAKIFWSNKSNTFSPSLSHPGIDTGKWISYEQCSNKITASSAKWPVLNLQKPLKSDGLAKSSYLNSVADCIQNQWTRGISSS